MPSRQGGNRTGFLRMALTNTADWKERETEKNRKKREKRENEMTKNNHSTSERDKQSGRDQRGTVRSVCALFVFGIFLLFSAPAFAALFCLVSTKSAQKECIFADAQHCEDEASSRGGRCTVNIDELLVVTGNEPVCIVYTPTTATCMYQEFDDCRRDAKRNNAACVNLSRQQIFDKTQSGSIDTQRNESK